MSMSVSAVETLPLRLWLAFERAKVTKMVLNSYSQHFFANRAGLSTPCRIHLAFLRTCHASGMGKVQAPSQEELRRTYR